MVFLKHQIYNSKLKPHVEGHHKITGIFLFFLIKIKSVTQANNVYSVGHNCHFISKHQKLDDHYIHHFTTKTILTIVVVAKIVRQRHGCYVAVAVVGVKHGAAELECAEKSMVVEEVVDSKALERNDYPELGFDLKVVPVVDVNCEMLD
jgi:hypothetical protein